MQRNQVYFIKGTKGFSYQIFLKVSFFNHFVIMHVCMYVRCVHGEVCIYELRYSLNIEEGVRSPSSGVLGDWKLLATELNPM